MRKKKVEKAKQEPVNTMNKIIAEINKYNKEHKTYISYGKYIAKKGIR